MQFCVVCTVICSLAWLNVASIRLDSAKSAMQQSRRKKYNLNAGETIQNLIPLGFYIASVLFADSVSMPKHKSREKCNLKSQV